MAEVEEGKGKGKEWVSFSPTLSVAGDWGNLLNPKTKKKKKKEKKKKDNKSKTDTNWEIVPRFIEI